MSHRRFPDADPRVALRAFLLAMLCILGAARVFAVEKGPLLADLKKMSLEELMNIEVETVYAASKHEQKVTEAPSSVTIITADDIRKYGYRTMADVLKSVRSFYVTYDRTLSYVGVRGFGRPGDYNSRILLLLDGHRVNDNVFDSALIGTEGGLDIDLIERIEIVRGPGSSLYGNNAFFAVINIITKRGRDYEGVEVSGEAAGFGTLKGRVTAGKRFGKETEALLSATAYDSKGQRLYYPEFDPANPAHDPRAANNGITENTDNDTYQDYFTSLAWKDFTLQAGYTSRTKRIPTGAFGIDWNDPRNLVKDWGGVADVKYRHQVARRTDLFAMLFYDYYSYEGNYLYSGVMNKDTAMGTRWGAEVRLTTEVLSGHRITVGTEFQHDMRQDQKSYFVGMPPFLDDHRSSKRYALYVQDEITLSSAVLFNAGVRYDHYDTFGGTTNPRLALLYSPAPKTSIKLLYGTAFRAPNVYELYYNIPAFPPAPAAIGNPDLKPEQIETSEVVYEQYLGERFRYTLAAYYYSIRNLIDSTIVGGNRVFVNVDRVRTRGFEAGLENRWLNGVDGRASYSYQKPENATTGEGLTNSPAHLIKLNVAVPVVRERVWAALEEQYMSRRKTVGGNSVSGFAVTNLTLFSRGLHQRLELSASVYNLFDRAYYDPVSTDFVQDSLQQDGRSCRLKLTYLF